MAQTVVARRIEEKVEPIFHPDSYGYWPRRSALDAVAACRQRCWRYDWVVDLDVQAFFDSIDHDLMIKAVEANTDLPWVLLYVKRWLTAPMQQPDGSLQPRDRGTPQGSAVSPVLANLFLHYAFDTWMVRTFPSVPFERYADDAVVHCASERQAHVVRQAIEDRMVEVGLRLHPDKTKIVYCKDTNRRGIHPDTSFTFLGYTFRPRGAKDRHGELFIAFLPAVSKDALKRLSRTVLRWQIHRRLDLSWAELAEMINPVVRGWMSYYGRFYRSALYTFLARINSYLVRWIRKKYRRLRPRRKARVVWERIISQHPRYFAHWAWVRNPLMMARVVRAE
ncbi:group II intron reverse transcriptase/maturase [Actinoplanes lobatus]|uniref:Group II intron reverse transcriptase/maturase n=1 Tax=Actinoplanes lobatus TaxID=113568 RepID=A0A7W7HR59_9ACTN|nr:group II intron reverse transcriptase/maturase [Actinoplanes lobatus]GGN88960.1 group II intron reverse transcriptase/maturase [Actinoplanes lobatus]GIE43393.1 group II intron reverse transcriptase/maturase [Actinoplanes lobatus]